MFKIDINKPPIAPPNRCRNAGGWHDGMETKESKKVHSEYEKYLEAYGEALDNASRL